MLFDACKSPEQQVRRTPLEKQISELLQQQQEEDEKNDDGCFRLDVDKERIRHMVGESFAKEPMMIWVGSHCRFASDEEWIDFARFANSYSLLEDLGSRNNFQLCETDGDKDDTIVSFASISEYIPKQHMRRKGPFTKLRSECKMGLLTLRLLWQYKEKLPPAMQHKEWMDIMDQKTERWVDEVDDWHIRNGPKDNHWYLHLLGCNPKYDGQGKGKKMMNMICYLADQLQQDMYTEAGGPLGTYYQKFGFEIHEIIELEDPNDPSNKFPIHIMTRTHRST